MAIEVLSADQNKPNDDAVEVVAAVDDESLQEVDTAIIADANAGQPTTNKSSKSILNVLKSRRGSFSKKFTEMDNKSADDETTSKSTHEDLIGNSGSYDDEESVPPPPPPPLSSYPIDYDGNKVDISSNNVDDDASHKKKRFIAIGITVLSSLLLIVGLSVGLTSTSNNNNNNNNNLSAAANSDENNSTSITLNDNSNPTSKDESLIAPAASALPTKQPSNYPTIASSSFVPTYNSTAMYTVMPFTPGDLSITVKELGIQMSTGLSVKIIAMEGKRVKLANGDKSANVFHPNMDMAGIISLPDNSDGGGGYVYTCNSEKDDGLGGVYGVYFNRDGSVVDYKQLLSGTSKNCGGGITPWNTWVSCEEVETGQCWQVDPNPAGENYSSPKQTMLGGKNGGKFESMAVDNSNPERPIFFVTEDSSTGAIRRVQTYANGWDSLHNSDGGVTTYLRIIDDEYFEWTSSISAGRRSAELHYPNSEGIVHHKGKLFFTAKTEKTFFILDLQDMTYTKEWTGELFSGRGSFTAEPDQIMLGANYQYMYFCEDGGEKPGVYMRDLDGTYYTLFRGIPYGELDGDETVGLQLSPDGTKLYSGFQDTGVLLEFSRDDGLQFD